MCVGVNVFAHHFCWKTSVVGVMRPQKQTWCFGWGQD